MPDLSPPVETVSRHRSMILAASLLSIFMSAVEGTIIATVIPSIVGRLGDFHLFPWLFAIYLLTQAVTQPVYGRLSDIYGRGRVYYVGAGLFIIGSLLCGLATSMVQLVLFRGIQGIGAGVLQPIAITLIADNYHGEERTHKQAWISAVWGIAAIVGPVFGAFLVDFFDWRAVFWINVPIGLAAIAMVARYVSDGAHPTGHKVDYAGAALLMFGAGIVLAGLGQLATEPWIVSTAIIGAGLALLALLFWVEARADDPIVPLSLWTIRTLRVSYLGAILIGTILTCVVAFLPAYVQAVLGAGAQATAMVVVALQLGWTSVSMTGARLINLMPFRFSGAIGGFFLVLGALILMMMTPERGLAWPVAGAAVIGMGMGASNLTYVLVGQTGIDADLRGGAVSMTLFMRSIGTSVGASLGGMVLNWNVERLAPGMGSVIQEMMRAGQHAAIDPAVAARVGGAIATGLHDVYLGMLVIALCAFATPWFLPRVFGPWTTEQV